MANQTCSKKPLKPYAPPFYSSRFNHHHASRTNCVVPNRKPKDKPRFNKGAKRLFIKKQHHREIWKYHVCFTRKSWLLFKSKKIAQVVSALIKSKNSLVKHFEDMRLCRPSKEYLQVWFNPPRDESMSCETTNGMRTIGEVCTRRFRESLRRVTDGAEAFLILTLFILCLDKVSTDHAKLVPLDEGASSERLSEAQPSPSPEPTSEAPNESLPDSSSAQSSEVPFEQQPDLSPSPSPRPSPHPSPTPIIPDSIPEHTGENLGDHSFNDTSLSGNEDAMTLQNVYDLCISLCKQEAKDNKRKRYSKKKRVQIESVSKQGRKNAKGDGKAKENAQSEGPVPGPLHPLPFPPTASPTTNSIEASCAPPPIPCSMAHPSTSPPVLPTDEQMESNDDQVDASEEIFEGIEEKVESTADKKESTKEQTWLGKCKKQWEAEEEKKQSLLKNKPKQIEALRFKDFDDIKANTKERSKDEDKDEESTRKRKLEKKYPLKKEILVQMLNLRLESEEESTMALELIRFIKKVLADLELKKQEDG
ncbi:hypothetical protein Tco_0007949 [Tanacetum coccineum]